MDQSRQISQFRIANKDTPSTIMTCHNNESPTVTCRFCAEHLSQNTKLRKNQILLEYQLEKVKEERDKLERENHQLINEKLLTYQEYQKKVDAENTDYWNREDLEAQLFEAKIIIELLLVSKSSLPQIKLITDDTLKQKYSDLLLQNLKLHQKIQVRDKIIEEKSCFPIYHYDKRLEMLKKAIGFWYKKSEQDCTRIKNKFKDMKAKLQEDKKILLNRVQAQMQNSRMQLQSLLVQHGKKNKQAEKKKNMSFVGKSSEIKKIR